MADKWDELIIPWINTPTVQTDAEIEQELWWSFEDNQIEQELTRKIDKIDKVDALDVKEDNTWTTWGFNDWPWVLTWFQWQEQEQIRQNNIANQADENSRKAFNAELDKLNKARDNARAWWTLTERQNAQRAIDAHKSWQVFKWFKEWQVEIPKVNVPEQKTEEEKKTEQLTNQTTEENLKTQQNQKTLTEFSTTLSSGNLQWVEKIALTNPELREDFNSIIKTDLKNKAWIDYFRKYSWMTSEQLQTAVDNWEITIWSDKFNTLPPEQRASFEAYNKAFVASKSGDKEYDKNKFTNDNNNIISTNKEEWTIAWFQWLDIRKKYTELLNSPELKSSSSKLTDLQDEVNVLNDDLDRIKDDVEEQFPNLPRSAQSALITQRQKSILRAKNTKINEYNSELGNYTRLKDNIALELDFAKYEDAQNRADYNSKLDAYKASLTAKTAERKRLTDVATKEFEAENKIKAAEVKFQNQLKLKEFEASLKPTDKKGTYETNRDGKLLYIVDWVATEVSEASWDLVFTEDNTEKEYKDTTYSKDWVYTTVRTYENWDKPDYFTHSINWKSTSNLNVYDNMAWIPDSWLQCWEAANKYISGLWISSKDFWVWDTYASKAKYIDKTISTPEPWMLAIWNPWSVDSKWGTDYWHIGIVSWSVQPDWMVEITDWNMDWDEKKSTRMVDIRTIKASDWGFYNPEPPKLTAYASEDTPLYKKFLAGKLTSSDQKTIKNFDEFKIQAELYQKDLTEKGTSQIEKVLKLATDLRDNAPWRFDRIASWIETAQAFSSDLADYNANFQAFISNQALGNLVQLKADWATFGALSDKELQFIQASATNLKNNLSDTAFKKELNRIIDSLKSWLSEERLTELETPVIEDIPITNWYSAYKERRKKIDYTKY